MEKKQSRDEDERKRVEAEREEVIRRDTKHKIKQPPVNVAPMEPVTRHAYGGGMYGSEAEQGRPAKPAASQNQSADGPDEFSELKPKYKPPPSTGDRDLDITGQSYIQ